MPCSFNNDEKTDTGCFPLSIDVVEGGRQTAESQKGSLLCELYLLSLIKFKGQQVKWQLIKKERKRE